jgi:hypothetical protein
VAANCTDGSRDHAGPSFEELSLWKEANSLTSPHLEHFFIIV